MVKEKALWIDCVAGSELRDSQGETLSIEGADITALQHGEGRWNDNHGKGFFNSIGRVTEAKKIFKEEDCETERQRYYWEKIKAPYIYAAGYLYNDEDHPNAKAAAAILRNIHKSDCPLKIKASVEGGVISRGIKDPSKLERTKIHSIAITFTPANKATLVEPLNIVKSISAEQDKVDQELIKSVLHLARKDEEIPSFRHVQRNAQANKIIANIEKIQELAKATGINIHIESTDTETLIKKAVEAKVLNNVKKIKELMKAYRTNQMWGEKDTPVSTPKSKLGIVNQSVNKPVNEVQSPKADYTPQPPQAQSPGIKPSGEFTTPQDPAKKPASTPIKSAKEVNAANTFKRHALRANKDPKYLDSLKSQLSDHNVDTARIDAIVGKIQQHMAKQEDDIEKGEFKDLARAAVLTGALATGAHYIGAKHDSKPASIDKPAQVKEIPHHEKKIQWDQTKAIDPKGPYRKPTMKEWAERSKKKKVKKALTAGYGGAGSPMDLTQGGIMQSESNESGFKYITCKQCGKEQIYAQHQVKCRECNKNFSLKDLHAVINS